MMRLGMRVVKVRGAGHTVWRDEPGGFATVLGDWLRRNVLAPAHAAG